MDEQLFTVDFGHATPIMAQAGDPHLDRFSRKMVFSAPAHR